MSPCQLISDTVEQLRHTGVYTSGDWWCNYAKLCANVLIDVYERFEVRSLKARGYPAPTALLTKICIGSPKHVIRFSNVPPRRLTTPPIPRIHSQLDHAHMHHRPLHLLSQFHSPESSEIANICWKNECGVWRSNRGLCRALFSFS